jgi:hypothetical protein
MFRLLHRLGEAEDLKPAKQATPRGRDPQYIPPGPDDGLWLDGAPKGSPEHRAWLRWLSE